jgi:acetyl esterase
VHASLEQLACLPPALVITAEADVVRDEGEADADKLRDAGVPVTADRFQAIIHDFVMLNTLADTNAAQGTIILATDPLRAVVSDKTCVSRLLGPSDRCNKALMGVEKTSDE